MKQYLALLRGINVGGKNVIRMEELRRLFESFGFSEVKTIIQSGNIVFRSPEEDRGKLKALIEKGLGPSFSSPVAVMLRSSHDLIRMKEEDPFGDCVNREKIKLYVCFLEKPPVRIPEVPLSNEKEAVDVIRITGSEAFIISHPLKDEHYGFPNHFIEKELKVLSTARNWNTVVQITEKYLL
jgi:uncharacterized protein (DUF1697 family)